MARATIILVDVPVSKVDAVHKRLRLCSDRTGDELIGYHNYGDSYALFVVKMKRKEYIPRHLLVLGPALQAGSIASFTFTTCYLVRVIFNTPQEVEQLNTFPLRERESWFPSASEAHEGYLCLTSNILTQQQSDWIVANARKMQQEQGTEEFAREWQK